MFVGQEQLCRYFCHPSNAAYVREHSDAKAVKLAVVVPDESQTVHGVLVALVLGWDNKICVNLCGAINIGKLMA